MISVSHAGGISRFNVSIANPDDTIYIKGDDVTDGSIRIVFTEGDTFSHLELRTSGVWNDTGLRLSSSSLKLGFDMTISAIAGYIETINPSAIAGHQRSIIPHIEFDDAIGTTRSQLHVPITNITETFVLFSTPVGETTGTTIGQIILDSPGRVLSTSIHEVGITGASAEVTVKWFVGTDNTGTLVNSRNLPSSDLLANTTLTIVYNEDFGLDAGTTYFQEFSSAANFSLKTDSGGNVITSHLGHELSDLNGVTENLMLDESLNVMFDTNSDPMYSVQFP